MAKFLAFFLLNIFLLCRTSIASPTNGKKPDSGAGVQNTQPPKRSKSQSIHDKRIIQALDKLPPGVRETLTRGGADAFKNMTKEMIRKLPASVYASVGIDAIRSMDREQLKEMTMNMNKGTNSKDLETILGEVDENQFNDMLEDMQNSSQKLSKKQMEAFTKQMKAKRGDPSTWSADTVKQLGKMVTGLSPRELKELAGAGPTTFEASLEEIRKGNVKELSKGQKLEIVSGALQTYGSQDRWNASTVQKMSKFIGSMKGEDLRKIPTTALKGALADLAASDMDKKSSRQLLTKLKDPTNGYGTPDSWNSETLRSMGSLSSGMTVKDIKNLDKNAVKGALDTLGKAKLSTSQAKKLASKMKEALGSPDSWSAETIKNASNILRGLKPKDLRSLPADAIKGSLKELKTIEFSRGQARELAKKMKETLGNPSSWNESVAEEMGPLVGGLPLSDLKNMSNNVLKSVLKTLKQDDSIPPSKKRAIIAKAKAAGHFKLLEAGSFLKTFSLKDLENVDPINDLGLNDTIEANSTTDTDRELLSWKLSQARKVLEKIKAIWGEPDDANSGWTLENIVRLKGLAIGVWKGLIDKIPAHDIVDVLEEFSQRDGFTPGQVKMILRAYKEKMRLETPSNFSSLDEIEVDSLGRFITELDDADLEHLSNYSGIEAVRQMGQLELKEKPHRLIKRKLKIALKLIARMRRLQDVRPNDLLSQDLEDLGNLALGFSPEEVANMTSDAFRGAVQVFGQIIGFNREQLTALASKVKEAYK
ncbi:uncharacterized protein LOC116305227 [Actinia tenebrosa]|uniref:Uncharacterized protein LOC116305227 n=1 Tax=Actinia tenebrosa TaxID=6105 RepID=A0A6P8IVF0_ACTTE|nr:uncharacterized protein LOC116305227 [Actinia tenebrosa]